MPTGIGLGIAGAGAASSIIGGKDHANAQQNIASSQLGQAQNERAGAMSAAQPTSYDIDALTQQLANYQNTYSLQQAQLQRDISLSDTVNPQLQALLQGKNAPTLDPYLNIVQNQKQSLMADLQRQLGPGWENTTAGQQALQNFNLQSSNQGAQIQQQYLGSMFANNLALGSSVSGQINQGAQTLNSISQGIAGGSNAIQSRQIAASEGTSLTPYSGAQFAGQLGQGQMLGNLGNAALGAGTTLGTLGAYKSLMGGGGAGGGGGGNGFGGTIDSYGLGQIGTGALPSSGPYSVNG